MLAESVPLILADSEGVVAIIAVAGGIVITVVMVVFGSIKRVCQTRETEQTRREVAAYVAEGSITADEGERLMRAARHDADD